VSVLADSVVLALAGRFELLTELYFVLVPHFEPLREVLDIVLPHPLPSVLKLCREISALTVEAGSLVPFLNFSEHRS
jgi:hypothetical protein